MRRASTHYMAWGGRFVASAVVGRTLAIFPVTKEAVDSSRSDRLSTGLVEKSARAIDDFNTVNE